MRASVPAASGMLTRTSITNSILGILLGIQCFKFLLLRPLFPVFTHRLQEDNLTWIFVDLLTLSLLGPFHTKSPLLLSRLLTDLLLDPITRLPNHRPYYVLSRAAISCPVLLHLCF